RVRPRRLLPVPLRRRSLEAHRGIREQIPNPKSQIRTEDKFASVRIWNLRFGIFLSVFFPEDRAAARALAQQEVEVAVVQQRENVLLQRRQLLPTRAGRVLDAPTRPQQLLQE